MLNSSIFGSIMIKRTSSGVALKSIDIIMPFTPTDLPEPVMPATKRCGILAKSPTTGTPAMSLPSATVSLDLASVNTLAAKISLSITSWRRALGNSMPMVFLPAMVSTTRTACNDIERAKSLASPTIWLPFTPWAGSISKRVITGPAVADTTCTPMPNSASLASMRSAVCCNTSGLTTGASPWGWRSSANEGLLYSPEGKGSAAWPFSSNKAGCTGALGGATDTATALRLLLVPSIFSTGSAVMLFASRTMRRVVLASGSSLMYLCSLRISFSHSHSILAPAFSRISSHEACTSSDKAKSIITRIISRLPEVPKSQLMPCAANEPIRPPAPTGSASASWVLKANTSKIGLHIKSTNRPMAAMVVL